MGRLGLKWVVLVALAVAGFTAATAFGRTSPKFANWAASTALRASMTSSDSLTWGTATDYPAPDFTILRTIDVSTASDFWSAWKHIRPGDRINVHGVAFTGESIFSKQLSDWATVHFDSATTFRGAAGSNLPAVWIKGCRHIRFYGGDLANPAGGAGITIYDSSYFFWWNFVIHDTANTGLFVQGIKAANDHLDLKGEISHWGLNPALDPHHEKGTGLQGANLGDANYGVTSSRFALYLHDGAAGSGLAAAGSKSTDGVWDNTLYLWCQNLTMQATSQVAGNCAEIWGQNVTGNTFAYLEAENLQGRAYDANGIWSGQSLASDSVVYGRASSTNLNPHLASTESSLSPGTAWDPRHGTVFVDVPSAEPPTTTTTTVTTPTTTTATTTTTTTTTTTPTTPSAPTFASVTDWERPSPATPADAQDSGWRLVPFTDKSGLTAALNGMQAKDYIYYAGQGVLSISSPSGHGLTLAKKPSGPVVLDFGTRQSIWNPAAESGNYVAFSSTSPSRYAGLFVHDSTNLRIYGGDYSSTGGPGIVVEGGTTDNVFWDFYVHDTHWDGIDLFPLTVGGDAITGNSFRGEITRWGGNVSSPSWDPHAEQGTGIHGAQVADVSSGGPFTGNTLALYVHDGMTGAGIQFGQPTGGGAITGNTIYVKAVNLTKASTSQVAGNALQFWGNHDLTGTVIGWAEGTNLQGRVVDANGMSGLLYITGLVTVLHGRHTNTNLNPSYPASNRTNPYDPTHGILFTDSN
ncbi:MAG: hypothetical protein QOG85_523 [Gaiellaceae bacterium]|jgi:hypothetical protein|nr:hypothetical protein [Gaiellaceae bacterium]